MFIPMSVQIPANAISWFLQLQLGPRAGTINMWLRNRQIAIAGMHAGLQTRPLLRYTW
jgi:hypothetical protein